MATMRSAHILLACSLMAFCMVVSAQPSPAPQPFGSGPSSSVPGPSAAFGPAGDPCVNSLLNMSDCLTYVEAGSNLTEPDKPCCAELAGLVDSNAICLCKLLGKNNSLGSFGIDIDFSRALKLPSVCKVSTPPVSTCAAVGVPVGVPLPSDGALSPGAQPPEGVAAGPSTVVNSNDNGATSNAGSVLAVTAGLAIAFVI